MKYFCNGGISNHKRLDYFNDGDECIQQSHHQGQLTIYLSTLLYSYTHTHKSINQITVFSLLAHAPPTDPNQIKSNDRHTNAASEQRHEASASWVIRGYREGEVCDGACADEGATRRSSVGE